MTATLNKDGTPRKVGSGKTKGAGCFAKIRWEQLREFIKEDDDILVSRVWLREVGALNQKKGSKKKHRAATEHSKRAKTPKEPAPRALPNSIQPKKDLKDLSTHLENFDDEDYNPPIFANTGIIKKY
jgi:hypothetical protein